MYARVHSFQLFRTVTIDAFYKGFSTLDESYDIICKFDADVILPTNYLERLSELFSDNNSAYLVARFESNN